MKSALGLMSAWILFLAAGIVSTLFAGLFDIYAAASLIFALPYLVFLYFGMKAKRWAYLGSSVLSVIVLSVIGLTFQLEFYSGIPGIYLWEAFLATLLSALIAVEGFKGYLELGGVPAY
jgi:hypothetical protein